MRGIISILTTMGGATRFSPIRLISRVIRDEMAIISSFFDPTNEDSQSYTSSAGGKG